MRTVGSEKQPGRTRSASLRLARSAMPPLLLAALAGCQTAGEAPRSDASLGMLIARDKCSSCHETFLDLESPNPDAPPFREIVNRPGMTRDALAGWLRDGHNYPVEMGFHLEPHQVDSLVAYMIRSRQDGPASGS